MEKLEITELWVKGGTLFIGPGVKSPRSHTGGSEVQAGS